MSETGDVAGTSSAELCGWYAPTFADPELEAAFKADHLAQLVGRRIVVLYTLRGALLLLVWHVGRYFVCMVGKNSEVVDALDRHSMLGTCIAVAAYPAVRCTSMARRPSFGSAWVRDTSIFFSAVLTASAALTSGWASAKLVSVGGVFLSIFTLFVQLPPAHCLALVHLVAVACLVLPADLVAEGQGAATSSEGVWTRASLVDQIFDAACLYVLGLLLCFGRRSEELQQRRVFAQGSVLRQALKARERHTRELREECARLEEALRALQEGGQHSTPGPGGAEAVARTAPAKWEEPAPAAAAAAAAAKGRDLPLRDLTVPPPPLRPEGSEAANRSGVRKESRAPNAVLVSAMAGRTSDWGRIQRMAEQIQCPGYNLEVFFEDCIASFPELSLFFEGTSSKMPKGNKQASSGLSGEAEYQRTIGALFTVYWMLRLDGDGKAGFCNGVDKSWAPIKVHPVATPGKSFASMTAEEKRANFAETMDWKLFQDLVMRAGCAPGMPGSTARIMALLCLSAFHDIMKLPMLQPIVQPEHAPYNGYEAGVRIHDHDLALSYVLECFPNLLPSYAGLPGNEKRGVLFTQGKMQFNHGWFVQAEAPPGGMLSKFKAVLEAGAEQADIDLYFLHWITDLAGAEATPLGGAEKLVTKFPKAVLASFLWSMTYLSRLVGMSETALVEQYLEARWHVLLPDLEVPSGPSAIALMRLALMTQAEDAFEVVRAFEGLSASDQACLVTELAHTGCAGQTFKRNVVCGGPAFLVYYGPYLLQCNNGTHEGLKAALHIMCVVLRGARALWPMSLRLESSTVILQIGELKARTLNAILNEARGVWVLLRNNDNEGTVLLRTPAEINALYMEDAQFRLLDFAIDVCAETSKMPSPEWSPSNPSPALFPSVEPSTPHATRALGSGPRILVFTDMSTECDDECALLWLLAALHRRGVPAVVELVQTDSHVRFQWMAHVFRDKFAPGGEWKLLDGGNSFQFKNVLVNMYLAHSPDREEMVINDMRKKAPHVALNIKEVDGRKVAVRPNGSIGGEDYSTIPEGPLNTIVVSAAIPDVAPEFFERFTACKCVYVVGTPGGINCPMPSWIDLLAAMHRLAPVLYLTPQLTRTVRFPRNYVAANEYWNDTIKHTVWDNVLTCMARRPEIPPRFGNWGLILRLNVANALFCKDWYVDVVGTRLEEAERPPDIVRSVQAYVDRNSGDDRQPGAIVDELKLIDVDVSPAALGLLESDFNLKGEPASPAAKEAIRRAYRHELFETTLLCVLIVDALLWKNKKNVKVGLDNGGFEKVQPRCGYVDPDNSLADLFGAEDAINLLKVLPLRWLTPAYDVVAMVCADCALEDCTDVDGGLDLLLENADDTMGLGMLSQEQRGLSEHPVLYTLPQTGHGVYAVGPFV